MGSNGVTEKGYSRLFNDPIHGHIRLEGDCLKVIDTPQFQRLRYINQLGAVHFVYHGATHTRFAHSIGTCYLSQLMLKMLKDLQPDLEIERHEMEAVTLAGLCHDVGHGPFSHALDNEIIPALTGGTRWDHEHRGLAVIDNLVEDNGLDINEDVLKMAKNLIVCEGCPTVNTTKYERRFLWDIVANSRNSVDVDKFDYLARDSYYCGMKPRFDHNRLMQVMRVIDGEICFNKTAAESVHDLFYARSYMHRFVYQHPTVKAFEYMIVDALKASNSVYHFENMLVRGKVHEFCKLDDSIYREISRSRDPKLKEAQEIIKHIEKRNHYKLANEFQVPAERIEGFKKVKAEDILAFAKQDKYIQLKSTDIIVHNMVVDYGKGTENPVDNVQFFDKNEPNKKFLLSSKQVSSLLPTNFKNLTIRVYSRRPETSVVNVISDATVAYQQQEFKEIIQRSPYKRVRENSYDNFSIAKPLFYSAFEHI